MPSRRQHRPLGLFSLQFQNLDSLGQDELAIHALLGNIADHAVTCKQFVELLERASSAVTDVVVTVVTEGNGILRYIR